MTGRDPPEMASTDKVPNPNQELLLMAHLISSPVAQSLRNYLLFQNRKKTPKKLTCTEHPSDNLREKKAPFPEIHKKETPDAPIGSAPSRRPHLVHGAPIARPRLDPEVGVAA